MTRFRSQSLGTVPGTIETVEEGQGRVVRMLNRLQRRKDRSDVRSIRGILGLGIFSVVFGLMALCVEATTKVKYPRASAALLSIEAAGIFVGCFSMLSGVLGIFTWKIAQSGHKSCLVKFHKTLCNFNIACSFGLFCLSLVALGIYTTLRDWQRKVSPFLAFESKVVKRLGHEELGFPQQYLEELVVLKSCSMSFHLLIFLTSAFTSIFCLFNIYVGSMPDFGNCASALTAVGNTLSLKRPKKISLA
ncbi:hypothetical protein RvY_19009 [Ramazzottius varieornatus]|uniref:Uncharacterized protein n=1 Tax=Ramazzottius varieornatus TaxID=947166 RepID=A0A1D1W7W5_RAMVA|nr:hypothetical protein RvY_19009 [Ramazzottius varieornatus]